MSTRFTMVHETQPIASGRIATLQIPAMQKIQSIALLFTTGGAPASEANVRSSIDNVRLTFNGKDIVNCSAADLYDLYERLGVHVFTPTGIPGVLELNVGPLLFVDPAVQKVLGFGTRNINNIQVQVTCGTVTAIDSVQCFTERTPVDEILGLHCKFLNYDINFNATGYNTYENLPRDPTTNYLMVGVKPGTTGVVATGECKMNNATIIEELPTAVSNLLAGNKGYNQISGQYLYNFTDGDFSLQSGIGLPMNGVTDFRLKTQFSVAPGASGYKLLALTLENVPVVQNVATR